MVEETRQLFLAFLAGRSAWPQPGAPSMLPGGGRGEFSSHHRVSFPIRAGPRLPSVSVSSAPPRPVVTGQLPSAICLRVRATG